MNLHTVSLAATIAFLGSLDASTADLSVNMSVPLTALKAGVPFVYDITVAYNGTTPATNLRLINSVPVGVQIISIEGATSPPVFEFSSGNNFDYMTVTIPDMPAGAGTRNIKIHARHGFSGSFSASTTVTGNAENDQSGNDFSFKQTSATAPDDADQDTLPDWWEQLNGLSQQSATGDNGPGGDLDKDGVTNHQEFVGDTKANDPNSTLRLVIERQPNGDIDITFPSSNLRSYSYRLGNSLSQMSDPIPFARGYGGIHLLSRLPFGYSENAFYVLEASLP